MSWPNEGSRQAVNKIKEAIERTVAALEKAKKVEGAKLTAEAMLRRAEELKRQLKSGKP